tara:strand:- start:604 stop:765 length:162 start_codon:yes stop_codon:yes gene_type:complete
MAFEGKRRRITYNLLSVRSGERCSFTSLAGAMCRAPILRFSGHLAAGGGMPFA